MSKNAKVPAKVAPAKVFTVGGSSVFFGVHALRVANNITQRVSTLRYYGHENIKLVALPKAMTKVDAFAWLAKNGHAKAVAPSKAVYAAVA